MSYTSIPTRWPPRVCATALVVAGLACPASGADLSWTNHSGYRAAEVIPAGPGKTGFVQIPPDGSGLRFTNSLSIDRHITNQILLNGSGVAAGDLDGDGWCDLVFAGLGGQTTIYRNRGDWRFEDITPRRTVPLSQLDGSGVACADADGDGDLDVVLNTVGQGTLLLENQGGGRFEVSRSSPLLNPGRCGTSSALADVDGDGDLDLYIANYRVNTMRDEPHLSFTIGRDQGRARVTAYGNRPITAPDLVHRFKFHEQATAGGGATVFHDEQGEPDAFLRNEGQGRFVAVPWTTGVFLDAAGQPLVEPPFDWGLSALLRDLNGDGTPDLYVCNDFTSPDRIWMNDGTGRFRPLAPHAIRQISLSSMAVDAADLNRDGHDDLFTADMLSPEGWRRLVQMHQPNPNLHLFTDVLTRPQSPRNTLQVARGDGTYAELAQMAGLEASDWSWAVAFLDVDLDGYEDLLVCNGFERDFMNMDANRRVRAAQAGIPRSAPVAARLAPNRLYPRLATENLAYRNLGNLRFSEVGKSWGFNVAAVSQGMCLADLDNDGDLDAAINNLNGAATLLRNDTTAPRLAIRLRGLPPNTRGIGARLLVTGGAVPRQTQEILAGGRYLSGDEPIRVFAAGHATNRLSVEVRWRSGRLSLLTNLLPNQICEIAETGARIVELPQPATAVATPLFADASAQLGHTHQQAASDELAIQPMLPFRYDTKGPGVAWQDLDGDGWEDLILPAGEGGVLTIYRNEGRGRFARQADPVLAAPVDPSQTAVVAWRGAGGRSVVLTGLSRMAAEELANAPAAREYRLESSRWSTASFPVTERATGPLALADLDGDGSLELLAGGRWIPGRWPEAVSSAIFRQEQGRWTTDLENSNVLHGIGMVNDAVFSDLDGDGDPDLVLACDWGPLRVLSNNQGRLAPSDRKLKFVGGTAPAGITNLSQLTGLWNGVNAGDFDGDGRLDLVAANWGRNSRYERFSARPLRVYFGDFDGNGRVEIVESWFDPTLGHYAPARDVWTLSRTLPWLLTRFNSHEAFSRVTIETALGEQARTASHWEATWLDSTVLLNRGDHFEVRPLPPAAQVAPAFATAVADFNGDGREDVFLSQNFFGVRPEASRLDAGRGLVLLGDGTGNFAPMPGRESGVEVYGEQRGAAVCDYDGDGRADLVVAQFRGETKLFHNENAPPGLRVRLEGPTGNPHGVGTLLRLEFGGRLGPAREIHAGAGYGSQDSAVPVLTGTKIPTALWLRWPGGKDGDHRHPGWGQGDRGGVVRADTNRALAACRGWHRLDGDFAHDGQASCRTLCRKLHRQSSRQRNAKAHFLPAPTKRGPERDASNSWGGLEALPCFCAVNCRADSRPRR